MDGLKLSPFLTAIALAALATYGCGSPVKSEKSLTPPFTIPSGNWADPTNPDTDEEPSEAAGFFVKLLSDTAEIKTHRADTAYGGTTDNTQFYSGNFSTECRIPVGTTVAADRDILCYAEIEELDVYFSEMTIQYHLPPSMCSYAKFLPYFFYVWEPGAGETNLTVTFDENGAVIANSAGVSATTGAPECPAYDHTGSDGPNCCVGDYTLTTTQNRTAPDPPTVTTTEGEWGGTVGNCLSGPGTSASHSSYISADGIPLTKVQYVDGTGLNDKFKILAPIASSFNGYYISSNLWTANYYRNGDYLPGDDRPIGLRKPATAGVLPSDTYKFECHNRAEELQYRIRLMIREWNKDPVEEGLDPDDTSGSEIGGGLINDRLDWLDIGAAYPEADL